MVWIDLDRSVDRADRYTMAADAALVVDRPGRPTQTLERRWKEQ
jgi:hypothetical protein